MNEKAGEAASCINHMYSEGASKLGRDSRGDAEGRMNQMKKEYAIMNQICQRVVVGPAGVPTIEQNHEVDIELTPETYLVYKCDVLGLVAPLTFSIVYHEEKHFKKANLEAYLSATTRAPTKHNHELMFLRHNTFRVKLQDIGKTRENKN